MKSRVLAEPLGGVEINEADNSQSQPFPGGLLHLDLTQIYFRAVPFSETESSSDLHMLWLPMNECTELIRRVFDQFLHSGRDSFGIDHIPANVIERNGIGGKVERVVFPNKLGF